MNIKKQYFQYFIFAVISTLLNLAVQKAFELYFTKIYQAELYYTKILPAREITYGLFIQMFTATIIGFIFKYLADKIFIFKDKTKYLSGSHLFQIFLYGSFAVLTTLIFWMTELSFKYFFHFKNAEYFGAFIGLVLGYTIKFFLDRKYVFNKSN